MKNNTKEKILSSEFGENLENRPISSKYFHYAVSLEEMFCNKLSSALKPTFDKVIDSYCEFYASLFDEFEKFLFTFFSSIFN